MAAPTLSRHDDVFLIDFGDDENMTTDDWASAMQGMLDEVEGTEGPRALVTTGSAKHYSNGLDVSFMASVGGAEAGEYVLRVVDVVRRIMLLGVPTVAAVNGHAFGMGAFLVMAHDHAVMREDRGFVCFPEVHLSMSFPEHLMEIARASLTPPTLREALSTGHRYGGSEAQAAGIVNGVSSLDELRQAAIGHAAALSPTAGENLALIKRQLLPAIAARAESRQR